MFKKIIVSLFFSQIIFLGVFGYSKDYFVIEKETNLCGSFTIGNTENPNWLPEKWEAVFLDKTIYTDFLAIESCELGNTESCCKKLGYRYAGVPIGNSKVSSQRKAAEFIAQKSIIEVRSFNPSDYNLSATITRKEVMKIIMKASQKDIQLSCKEIFADVLSDWGCKYIETALTLGYISGIQGFRPDENLTQTEALKLIFKAKNIEKKYKTSHWQQDYISTAYYLSYIDEKFNDYNISATRGWIFEVLARTYDDF